MNLTLVACHGQKQAALRDFVLATQGVLAARLAAAFAPYRVEQVHATIVGLEGYRSLGSGELMSANAADLRGAPTPMHLGRALEILRAPSRWPMPIQLGGFRRELGYPFHSRGRHPYERAFAFTGESAVVIGWPRVGGAYPSTLGRLRRELEAAGVVHKYHVAPDDLDNDFFLVLGRVDRAAATEAGLHAVEREVRELVARAPVALSVDEGDLALVAYDDPSLPPESSIRYALADADPAALAARYATRAP